MTTPQTNWKASVDEQTGEVVPGTARCWIGTCSDCLHWDGLGRCQHPLVGRRCGTEVADDALYISDDIGAFTGPDFGCIHFNSAGTAIGKAIPPVTDAETAKAEGLELVAPGPKGRLARGPGGAVLIAYGDVRLAEGWKFED